MAGVCFLIFSWLVFASTCDSARILGLFTAPSRSHLMVHTAIIDALVEQGHEATVVTTVPIPKKNTKYRHVFVEVPGFSQDFLTKMVNDPQPFYKRFRTLSRKINECVNGSLHHPAMKTLMENETFDLVIMGYFLNDFQLGVAAHFKCPVIVSFMIRPVRIINEMVGNQPELAYVPNLFAGARQPMGFWDRVKNFIFVTFFEDIVIPIITERQQKTYYNQCDAARILGLFTSPPKSHLIIHTAIADALAERGHNMTIVTTTPLLRNNPLFRHILLDLPPFPQKFFNKTVNNPSPFFKQFVGITKMMYNTTNQSLHHPMMRKLMDEETFDLVLFGYFFNDFQLGVAAHFKCPVVMSFMVQPIRFLNEFVGNPKEVAYVPNIFTGVRQPMTFWERVKNFLMSEGLEELMTRIRITSQHEELYSSNFPPDKYPSLDEMRKNVSLVLTNHHFSQGPIRPNVPAMVEIGGIQIKEKPDPLPEDIKDFLDNAKHGVVYFSFGSNVQGSVLDKPKAKVMFDVLSKLPQKILWKWGESDFPGESPNIMYKSWLPQDDVLAHPNVKLFVTHGGQGGVVESEYNGVPMVGVPLFGEQHVNMANVVSRGFGLSVDFSTISAESFGGAVHEVLSNNRYRDNVRQFAKLYKDRPMTARQTAVFWVEYVLRHHGAPHMQSPAVHLNRFQLLSLDVIGFLIAVVYLVYKVIRVTCTFIFCRGSSKKKNKVA